MKTLPHESVFISLDAAATMEIIRELRAMGLIQGEDFEFKYNPSRYDNDGWTEVQSRGTDFYFREGKWVTYLTLKYGS